MMNHETTADLYVSTRGDNTWSGTLHEPNPEGSDGPLATIEAAQQILRERKEAGELSGNATVLVRGGRYQVRKTITFTPADSWPTTYAAYPGEQPILDGGAAIEGWRVEERRGRTVWVTEIADVKAGRWYFRQLFVNGRRRRRPRLPKEGRYRVKGVPPTHSFAPEYWGGEGNFICHEGDIKEWENMADVEVVAMHRWVEERLPVTSFDPQTGLVQSSRYCIFPLDPGDAADNEAPKYYVDNVKDALSEEGEWYLDRPTGELCYIPLPGETLEESEFFAPVIEQLLRLEGDPDDEQYVEHLHFAGIGFEHTECTLPPGGGERWVPHYRPELDYGSAPQGACHVPGAISFSGARYCRVENCRIQNIGWYGIELTAGSCGNHLVGNTIVDLGAGGIKAESRGYPNSDVPPPRRSGGNRITDNHIGDGGHVFHAALGVHCMDCFGTVIAHNHIHDFFYSGINCGWTWGYGVHVAKDNLIEKNHIHDIGHGVLSDMGGIYILGVQPGTVVRGNLVHDVEKSVYGGWGIYLDEGTSHIIVEKKHQLQLQQPGLRAALRQGEHRAQQHLRLRPRGPGPPRPRREPQRLHLRAQPGDHRRQALLHRRPALARGAQGHQHRPESILGRIGGNAPAMRQRSARAAPDRVRHGRLAGHGIRYPLDHRRSQIPRPGRVRLHPGKRFTGLGPRLRAHRSRRRGSPP